MDSAAATSFRKMNGLGNEIVVVDLRGTDRVLSAAEVRAIATTPGAHFDQLMVLHDARDAETDAYLRIYNRDGSTAGACGNGMRCVAFLLSGETGRNRMQLETPAGVLAAEVKSRERITIDMGAPRFRWDEIPLSEPFQDTRAIELQIGPIDAPILHSPSVINVGNPHAIFWVEDVEDYDLARIGPLLENHPLFPERANISLAEVVSRSALKVRTWERGAGLTKACGSAACAAAVAAARKGMTDRKVTVTLPGGDLTIEWTAGDRILMTGPVELEHEGTLDLSALKETA